MSATPSSPASLVATDADFLPSTAVSSPPATDAAGWEESSADDQEAEEKKPEDDVDRWTRLEFLLKKSAAYAQLLKQRMDLTLQRQRQLEMAEDDLDSEDASSIKGKRRRKETNSSSSARKKIKLEVDENDTRIFRQPQLVTGTKLKDYQLEGVAWMAGLHENGISGILADDMGLGKTLQTIAFSAYLRGRMGNPFLVVCPLSVLHNWEQEYGKFSPQIPICVYHGTPQERAEMRDTVMSLDLIPKDEEPEDEEPKPQPTRRGKKNKGRSVTKGQGSTRKKQPSPPPNESGDPPAVHETEESIHERALKNEFPVVLTTYDIIINDRTHLARYPWGFIVVDEGHRLKNMDCKLMQEIKQYESAGRMILTGTPLHNNLSELWSLLNFILPDIFNDLYSFQEWFNLSTTQTELSSQRSAEIVSTLQAIIKPFLLRRLKSDVEKDSIPPKKEYLIYAPLTETQREIYDAIVDGGLRSYLMSGKKEKQQKTVEADDGPMKLRSAKYKSGNTKQMAFDILDGDDDEYFRLLESGQLDEKTKRKREEDLTELGRKHQLQAKIKKINNMKLQNTVMQLRKVCSHPFLFDWPVDERTRQPIINEDLAHASGKMMMLERLLDELFARGHKVLLFSQFTMMLDIIEDWATEFKGWSLCRIDGSTPASDRSEQVALFQNPSKEKNPPRLFLLSTRAGGMGLNLVAADTVIFYDQDWNPQMDLQAQDRAHRIGQTKPVLVFRLVTNHTIETKIMQRATEKRQLETLVIAKGKFRAPTMAAEKPATKQQTMAQIAADLLRLEGEQIKVVPKGETGKKTVLLSDQELEMLLNRNLDEMANRGKGWNSAGVDLGESDTKAAAAFAVFNGPTEQDGSDVMSRLMGEPMAE